MSPLANPDVRAYRPDELVTAADLNALADVVRHARTRKAARVHRVTTKEVPRAKWEAFEFAHAMFNRHRLLSKSDPERLHLDGEGLWLAGFHSRVENVATSSLDVYSRIIKNGVRPIAGIGSVPTGYGYDVRPSCWGVTYVPPGVEEWLTAQIWQNHSDELRSAQDSQYAPHLWGIRLTQERRNFVYTTPPTFAAGDYPTALQLEQLAASLRYVMTPHAAFVTEADSDTSLAAASTWYSATLDSPRVDTSATQWSPTSGTRWTCRKDGIYLIGGSVQLAPSATIASAIGRLMLNGTTVIARTGNFATRTRTPTRIPIVTLRKFVVGDYVEVQSWANATGHVMEAAPDYGPSLWAVRLGEDSPAGTWGALSTLTRLDPSSLSAWLNTLGGNIQYLYAPPAVKLGRNTDQAHPGTGWATLNFTVEDFDTDNMHTTASRIDFNDAGLYLVGGAVAVQYASPGTVGHWTRIVLNGDVNQIVAHQGPMYPSNLVVPYVPVMTLIRAKAGDYAELQFYSEAATNMLMQNEHPQFWAIGVAA